MIWAMAGTSGKVHVVRVSKTGYVDKQGRRKDYSSAYLRRTYRDGGKVKNETVANLSALPGHVIDLIDAGLKGQQLVPAAEAVTITRSLPHGHVAAVHAMAAHAGPARAAGPGGPPAGPGPGPDHLPGGPAGLQAVHPDLVGRHHPGRRPRRGRGVSTDDIYAAMDWLEHRQDAIEAELARRHLAPAAQPVADGAVRPVVLVAGRLAAARWPPAATPGTARKANCRSSTGCSPTPKAARSRSGSSPATPATRPRSPPSRTWCGTSSGWPRWSWSATAG